MTLPIPEGTPHRSTAKTGELFVGKKFSGAAVIPKKDGSVQVVTVINSRSDSHSFRYGLDTKGASFQLESDGSVSILNAKKQWIAGVAKPWAQDAAGNSVSTRYSVEDSRLVQHVTPSSTTRYPVTADPYLGIKLIKKTVWARHLWKYSPTLKVYPTWWGRSASSIARGFAWEETLSKTKRKGWPNPDTKSMKNQFYCHYDFVRIRSPRKESWNLDTKIKNRGYWGFLKKGCN